jgi:hypothetical protein
MGGRYASGMALGQVQSKKEQNLSGIYRVEF